MAITINGTTGLAGVDGSASTPAVQGGDSNTGVFFPAADTVAIATGGSERLRADSSGNVGIGTSSPGHKLTLAGYSNVSSANKLAIGDVAGYQGLLSIESANEVFTIENTSDYVNGAINFRINGGDRARIDISGNLLVGTTTSNGLITSIQASTSAYSGYFTSNYTANNNASIMFWGRNGGAVAAAVRYKDTGTSMEFYSPTGHTVAYTTSSDYRLKENVQPMIGALASVMKLKPITYSWKEGFGTGDSQGFIAHELQAVVPQCVTGEKDAVDAEGNPVYQGIDTSFLVATLTAAIQEQQALIESLTARIAALEAA